MNNVVEHVMGFTAAAALATAIFFLARVVLS
jgi:hypothetical protein